MTVQSFLARYALTPEGIDGEAALETLLAHMELGLAGKGNIPMLPSYLRTDLQAPRGRRCCVLDAGGTNLRAALAEFDENGNCHISNVEKCPMPGSREILECGEFYDILAEKVRGTGMDSRIGFCFSYNLEMGPDLDGTLLAWCKEIRVPEAVGKPVGASLRKALGNQAEVTLLNDSVAAMLGAGPVRVGIILGTGVNVCYEERGLIPKIGTMGPMIISTEVGEFDGFPQGELDRALFAATEDPGSAHAEKQCAGGYLGELICLAWGQAAEEGLLPEGWKTATIPLAEISGLLARRELPENAAAIAECLIARSAKMAAILCAGPVLRCTAPGETGAIAVEGSQFQKLTGFRERFCRELEALLRPRGIGYLLTQREDACLRGAAIAAFAVTGA